jgi:hypothetical protein
MAGTVTRAFRAVFHESEVCGLRPLINVPPAEPARLRIYVLFTEIRETIAALKSAVALSTNLPAQIVLMVPLIVPYPLALEDPPVSLGFVCRRIGELAAAVPFEIDAYVYLCRDAEQAIRDSLGPASLVVIGSRRRWLFQKSSRIAKELRRLGHHVIRADLKQGEP